MLAHHMRGYWMQEGGGPGVQSKPFIWKWADIYTGLLKAGELVPAGSPAIAEPRTLSLRYGGVGRGSERGVAQPPDPDAGGRDPCPLRLEERGPFRGPGPARRR